IPFAEVSFFGSTEIAKALRAIARALENIVGVDEPSLTTTVESLIKREEKTLKESLKPYGHLRGKKAVLYTGGVKSWSFISALHDLGIEIAAVGTKKSTFEDEEKMKEILGPHAPLVEDVTPKNLLKLLRDREADMLIAGGRNQYLAVKEGYPFVDVNQERHTAYAGYEGLVNLAAQISNSVRFYEKGRGQGARVKDSGSQIADFRSRENRSKGVSQKSSILVNPLKHSPAIGAAMAFQGIDRALPIIHGAQGCTFLGKVLLTKHFREPIALATSKLFVEDVVMGSEEKLTSALDGFVEKSNPAVVGILTSALSEVKGDDVSTAITRAKGQGAGVRMIHVATPDYDGGLETGYARAVEAAIRSIEPRVPLMRSFEGGGHSETKNVNIIPGSHLTPADVTELRELVEAFGLSAIILPDLSALDGSRQVFSPLASGGIAVEDMEAMAGASFTIGLGMSMEPAAELLQRRFGIGYTVFDSISGLADSDRLMQALAEVSGRPMPERCERQRKVLVDAMRDAHSLFGGKKACIALEPDLAVQTSKWLEEMGAVVELAIIPALSEAADRIHAREVQIGDLFAAQGVFDVLIANSHAESASRRLGVPLYQMGFPVYKTLGYTSKITIGYRGTLTMINEVGSLMMKKY
ncbi:MAG TPA: nitrogenase iron-molybdenum cofactor biosynthesis protein NifN, partial [Nitrospirota bacterium]